MKNEYVYLTHICQYLNSLGIKDGLEFSIRTIKEDSSEKNGIAIENQLIFSMLELNKFQTISKKEPKSFSEKLYKKIRSQL